MSSGVPTLTLTTRNHAAYASPGTEGVFALVRDHSPLPPQANGARGTPWEPEDLTAGLLAGSGASPKTRTPVDEA